MLNTNVIRGILDEVNTISESGIIIVDDDAYTVKVNDFSALRNIFRKEVTAIKGYVPSSNLVRFHEICDTIESRLESISSDVCNIDTWLEFLKGGLYGLQGIFQSDDINDLLSDVIAVIRISQKYYPILGYSVVWDTK